MMTYFKTLTAATLGIWLVMAAPALAGVDVNVRAGIHERSNRLVFDWNQNVEYSFDHTGNRVTIQFNVHANAQLRSVTAVRPPFIQDIQQSNNDKGLSITFLVPTGSKIETFRLDKKVAFDVLRMQTGPLDFNGATAATPAPAAATPQQPATQPATQKETPVAEIPDEQAAMATIAQSRPIYPGLTTLADRLADKPPIQELNGAQPKQESKVQIPVNGTIIRLKPKQMTKLAAFVRAGKLWLVLDKALPKFMPDIQGAGLNQLSQNAKRIDLKEATAFVLDAPPADTVYSISRDQFDWLIALNPSDKPYLPDEIPVTTMPAQTGKQAKDMRVTLYTGEQPSIITIKDSSLGDRLWVIPVRAPEGRIIQPRTNPEFTFLPTFMGAVIIPQSDRVRIEKIKDLIVLSSKTDAAMRLSDKKDRELGLKEASYTPLFRFDVPYLKTKHFVDQRQEIESRLVAQEKPQDQVATLVDMARLYVANGFGQEAIGLLRIARQELPAIEADLDYQALHGMALSLAGDVEGASKILKSNSLRSQPAAKLWLGYALSKQGEWQAARAAFVESGTVENLLPKALQNRMALAKAETFLESEDVVSAEQGLKKIEDIKSLSPYEKAAYDYIDAGILSLQNKKDESQPIYEDLVNSHDQLYRVKAELALIEQNLADKKITAKDAIEDLERLRFSWRGDRLEIEILRRLGQYYVDNKQYMEGLTIWRQAASLSQNTDDTDRITQSMQDTFKDLYINGKSKDMDPLQAVAVFDRFRELTPSGRDGNLAMRHLADRLAEVDLLDQADTLLEKQMRQNATGVEAAKLGAKLAGLRLLNRNPGGALKALDESFQDDTALPKEIGEKRALLRARALADTGKTEDALYILNTLQSVEAYSLKADVSWRQNRWSDAVTALQKLTTLYRDEGKTAVDGPMPDLIMKMAIALTLDENTKGLDLLKAQYGEFMSKTAKAEAFNLITHPSRGSSLADLDTLMKQIGEVELFQSFLQKNEM